MGVASRGVGRPVVFSAARRELFLQAYANGLPIVSCCAAAGGINVETYLDWVKIGEGRAQPTRVISEERREAAVVFVNRLRAIEEIREVTLLERCSKTLEQAATEGFTRVKIRKTTRFDAKGKQVHSETVEDVEKAIPIWQASAWVKERRQQELWGTGQSRLAAAEAKRLEQGAGRVSTKEEAKAEIRSILAQMHPDDILEIVSDLLPTPEDADDA